MDSFEKFLMALGGVALMVAFGFPQVMGAFFIIILVIIILGVFICD